ncbi:hypothetical protein F5883DRAFT_384625, partial [Diaporthe sp. PMI_573]
PLPIITPDATTAFLLHPCHRDYSINSDNLWIEWNDQNVLWLPEHIRPNHSDVSWETVCMGCRSGRVWSIRF